MLTRILFSLITIFAATQVYAMRSLQADVGSDSYHIGFFSTYFGGDYGALAVSPDVIIKPAGESIFAPAAYWYYEWDNPLIQEVAGGVRAYFADYTHHDVTGTADALAFGMIARTRALSLNWPLHLFGSLHYAPESTSSDDINNLLAWSVNLEYALLREWYVYVGYRDIMVETALNDSEVHLDETGYIGIRWEF